MISSLDLIQKGHKSFRSISRHTDIIVRSIVVCIHFCGCHMPSEMEIRLPGLPLVYLASDDKLWYRTIIQVSIMRRKTTIRH